MPSKKPEVHQRATSRYRANHSDKVAEYLAIYRATHKKEIAAARRRWYAKNRKKLTEQARAYRAAHPEVHRLAKSKRRARERNLPNTLTADQWTAIKRLYKDCCAYCGEKKKLTQDHVIPLLKGGGTVASNIVPACLPCNARKHTNVPEVFPARLLL